MVEVGQEAPDFRLPDQDGSEVRLHALRGKPVVVYFYPKDDSPGCTTEACSFRDNWSTLQEHGVTVLGISADDVASHRAFVAKHDLPFSLLADTDMAVMKAWGAYGVKNMYGKKVTGIFRYTYVLDAQGVVIKLFKRPKTDVHAQEVLAVLA